MTLSIRDLEYLIAISETQSFSKAAEKCFVSQPTLSFQLKKLEDFYDIKLFERHHKKVIITSTGIELLNKAKEILSQCQQFDELAKSQGYVSSEEYEALKDLAKRLEQRVSKLEELLEGSEAK